MAKNIRKILATVLVMCMLVSALPMQALAADGDDVTTETTTETTRENGLTTSVTTTTTVTNGNSTPTVTVVVKESNTTGFTGPGQSVNSTETSTSTTVTHKDEDGNVVKEEVVHSKEETHTDTTTVTDNSITTQHTVDGKEQSTGEIPLPEGGVTVDVPLTEGESNSESFSDPAGTETVTGDVQEGEDDPEYDYEKSTVVEEGKVTVTNKDITITEEFESEETDLEYIKSETNPDGTNDLVHAGDVAPDAYLPGYEGETVIPEGAENDGYDYVFVGSGNTSKYVPAIVFTTPLSAEDKVAQYGEDAYIKNNSITYYFVGCLTDEVKSTIDKDENGNYVTDEEGFILDVNGNRILKEELTATDPDGNVVYLHRFDKTVTGHKVEGWYDSETGEWVEELNGDKYTAVWAGPQQFILVDDQGNIITTYCADFSTPTQDAFGYNIENLENATYYTEEEAEMIRSIAQNGYWGTDSGVGSLETMKEQLLASGQFTEEELAALNDGVALSATQMAIWTYSNKMTGIEFVNSHYSNWGVGNVPTDKEEEVELLFKLYNYLINLEPTKTQNKTSDTLITAENFVKDLSVTVIDMAEGHTNNQDHDTNNDAYTTKISFSLVVTPSGNSEDNLVAYLMDADGNVVASGRIAGEGEEEMLPQDENGNYYFDNVTMVEGGQSFQLNLSGVQYLEEGVYLYSSEISEESVSSQTMVGLASGKRGVNVTMDIQFELDVEGVMVTERVWHEERDPVVTTPPTPDVPQNDSPQGNEPAAANEEAAVQTTVFRMNNQDEDVVEIPEEPVPLATPVVTGDNSGMWIVLMLLSICAMASFNLFSKKRQGKAF